MQKNILESAKKINIIGEYDVLVVGGGIAGISAALAASRNDAKVCIIEKENALGGLATLGLVVFYLPLCDGMGNQVISGIAEKLLKLSIKDGYDTILDCWQKNGSKNERKKYRYQVKFNPASFMLALEEQILKSKIKILYDTRFCDVVVKNNKIKALIIENKSGRNAILCKTVIDTSGDADVCYKAGEKTVSLSTNRKSGWFFVYNNRKIELHQVGDPLYKELPTTIKTFSGDEYDDVTEMNIQSRKLILKKILKLKKNNKNIYPVLIPSIPQFRMTRRLQGTFELDEKDNKKFFYDSIGMTGDWRKRGPIFYIPYRCLIGAKIDNLITAGRCISVTTSAWDIIRAIPTCAVTGEASGTAAAMTSSNNEKFSNINMIKLQNKLKRKGVIIDRRFSVIYN